MSFSPISMRFAKAGIPNSSPLDATSNRLSKPYENRSTINELKDEPLRMNVKSRSALHGIVQQFLVGVGDDELKRRRLGLCLPRCLPF